jgi:hypothetical protein
MSLESKIEALTAAIEANTVALLSSPVENVMADPVRDKDIEADERPVEKQPAEKAAKKPTKAALEKVTTLCAAVAEKHDRKTVKGLITGLGVEKLGDLSSDQVKELSVLLQAL